MKVADIIKLVQDGTNVIIGHYSQSNYCDIGNDPFSCDDSDMDFNCGDCKYLIEHVEFSTEFKGESRDAPIKLADRTVLCMYIDITTSGRGKKAETIISLKIITRKPKED